MVKTRRLAAARLSPSSTFPCELKPSATPSRGHLFCQLSRSSLLAADDLGVIRRFGQKPARLHPLEFLVEFVGLIGLPPDQFGHQAGGAARDRVAPLDASGFRSRAATRCRD